jgi:hypothetical protein
LQLPNKAKRSKNTSEAPASHADSDVEVDIQPAEPVGRGKGDDPNTRIFYSKEVRQLLKVATDDMLASLMIEDPLVDDTDAIKDAKAAWKRATAAQTKKPEPTTGQIKSVSLSICSEFDTLVNPLV